MSVPRRVAILHYHLRPGGVSRVIEHAVTALRPRGVQTVVVTGTPASSCSVPAGRAVTVAELNYAKPGAKPQPERLRTGVETAVRRALGAPPDLWHVHNHSLGKQPALTETVRQWAAEGVPLLLQVHDFPEDGRPAAYRALRRDLAGGDPLRLSDALYPSGRRVHYALLAKRDVALLRKAGLPPSRLHWLPNAVDLPKSRNLVCRDQPGEFPLFLYPTRAIRRKNLGEFLLWAACGRDQARFAVSMSPIVSSPERIGYEAWLAFAARAQLPVEFDYGVRHCEPLSALLRRAHAAMTTSVAEGFGLAFLEPWLACRPLYGRDLPDVTRDFRALGLRFPGLYTRLPVPLEWMGGAHAYREVLRRGMARAWRAYGRTLQDGDVERAFQSSVEGEQVDFGRLDEALQRNVIRRVLRDADARATLLPELQRLLDSTDQRVIEQNRRQVQTECHLDRYGERLLALYRAVLKKAGAVSIEQPGERVLDLFLQPERFVLLRS